MLHNHYNNLGKLEKSHSTELGVYLFYEGIDSLTDALEHGGLWSDHLD